MKISITKNDKDNAFRKAISIVAKFHNIKHYEFKTKKELYAEIEQVNSPLFTFLTKYLTAYNNWFEFFSKRRENAEEIMEEHELNETEINEVNLLKTARDESLNSLQDKFNSLTNR